MEKVHKMELEIFGGKQDHAFSTSCKFISSLPQVWTKGFKGYRLFEARLNYYLTLDIHC